MRTGIVAGCILLFFVIAFVIWSFTLKVWCAQHVAWGEQVYGEELGKCVREKSLFSF